MVGIRLNQDVCIPGTGTCKSRQVVSKADCGDSWQWLIDNRYGQVLSEAEYAAAIASPVSVQAEEVEAEDEDDEDDEESEGDDVNASEPEQPAEPTGPETADGSNSVEPEKTAEPLSEDQQSVLKTVKEHLATGKSRLETILMQTGLTEDVVTPVLTEANGLRRNQQGWWGLI